MCKYFSAIVTRDGKVRWCESDDHETIISRLGLTDDCDHPGRRFVRIEVPDFDLAKYRVDEKSTAPPWYDDCEADVRAWLKEHRDDIIQGCMAYIQATESAQRDYHETEEAAWREYQKAEEAAWRAYRENDKSTWREFMKAVIPAWRLYQRVVAFACRSRDAALAVAGQRLVRLGFVPVPVRDDL